MDIAPVRASVIWSEDTDDSDDSNMAHDGGTIQGDYSGYVPPEITVTSGNAAAVSPRRASAPHSKPTQRGGPMRPESPTKVPIQVRGNLQKMGKRLKGWHIRYFEIQGTHMYYYKTHVKKECLGEINLSKCFFCDATSAATFGHPFEIKTTERTHILAARSKDEMVQWVRVIRKNKGATEEGETAGAKKGKPKRWQSFKQALAIQPRRPLSSKPPIAPNATKKQSKKSNKIRINRSSKDRGTSPNPSQGDAHTPLTQQREITHLQAQASRPMSLTENDFEQDTLDILASIQPTRSLPSTPLVAKRPVDFNESPSDSPIFLRKSAAGSPALTIDSQLSTPSHSATASPAHSPAKKHSEPAKQEETVQVKEEIVEIEAHPSSEPVAQEVIAEAKKEAEIKPEEASIEVPCVLVREPSPIESIPEDSVLEIEPPRIEPNEEATLKPLPPSKPKRSIPIEPSPAPVPEFMTKKYTWDEVRDVLEFNEEDVVMDYDGILPPEDPVWLDEPTGIQQLRAFLLTCP